jgi:hypothetical protein
MGGNRILVEVRGRLLAKTYSRTTDRTGLVVVVIVVVDAE